MDCLLIIYKIKLLIMLKKYNCYKMTSRSPANVKYILEKLIQEWSFIKKIIINIKKPFDKFSKGFLKSGTR